MHSEPVSLSSSSSRLFRMEVSGLRQGAETATQRFQIRQGGTMVVTVPYSRMNEEFKRINRLGGQILKVEPVDAANSEADA
jgi:phycocyanin-associated rod protein